MITVTGSEIVDIAREYLHVPFRHQGRDRNGIDCVGLLIAIAKRLDAKYWDNTNYSQQVIGSQLLQHVAFTCDEAKDESDLPGRILVFWTVKRNNPQHTAIRTYDDKIIHACSVVGSVVEQKLADNWKRRIYTTFRYRGMN